MINGLHHVVISTPDIRRLHRFYRDVLGFETVALISANRDDAKQDKGRCSLYNSKSRGIVMRCGTVYIQLREQIATDASSQSADLLPRMLGLTHLCLDVTDLNEEYGRLKSQGMPGLSQPRDFGDSLRASFGKDPDGNVLVFQEVMDAMHPVSLHLAQAN